MNAWIGHYVYREDDMRKKKDKPLTKRTFQKLTTGDVIESLRTRARYVVIEAKNAGDPIVQMKKDSIKDILQDYQIVMKVQR